MADLKTLTDEQLAAFHTEYVRGPRWLALLANIQRDFPEGRFRFLDIGGGNGMLADKLLEHFPHATGVVLDNSRLLLAKNTNHPRKQLVCASAVSLAALPEHHYDLVFINWVLHHLVSPTYQRTTQNQHEALAAAVRLVASHGRLSIFENMYEGVLFENLPGYLIFQLTSAPLLAGLTRRFGANTANVGVCFRSQRSWERMLTAAGLEILTTSLDPKPWKFTRSRKAALHIRSVRAALFWTQVKPV
ncbi:MAG: methyltransferase domain-containing protein [Chloroflexaceae bacterium]|nr:methyltransferase domain-containing protein [Chloroflexaceae bacterium]